MSNALTELIAAGGRLSVNGESLQYHIPQPRPGLLEALKADKPRLLPMLRACEALSVEIGIDALELAARIEDAYKRLGHELATHPTIRTAVETLTTDTDPVLLAMAVRNAGYAVIRIPQARYTPASMLQIIHRWNEPPSNSGG